MVKNHIYSWLVQNPQMFFFLWKKNIHAVGTEKSFWQAAAGWTLCFICGRLNFVAFGHWQFLCKSRISPSVEIHNSQPYQNWSCVKGNVSMPWRSWALCWNKMRPNVGNAARLETFMFTFGISPALPVFLNHILLLHTWQFPASDLQVNLH